MTERTHTPALHDRHDDESASVRSVQSFDTMLSWRRAFVGGVVRLLAREKSESATVTPSPALSLRNSGGKLGRYSQAVESKDYETVAAMIAASASTQLRNSDSKTGRVIRAYFAGDMWLVAEIFEGRKA